MTRLPSAKEMQIRGSVPLYWEQQQLTIKVTPSQLSETEKQTAAKATNEGIRLGDEAL